MGSEQLVPKHSDDLTMAAPLCELSIYRAASKPSFCHGQEEALISICLLHGLYLL